MRVAASLYIKYTGPNLNRTSEIDLKVLGESIQGFDHVLRELIHVLKIDADIEIKAAKISDGSILIKVLIALGSNAHFLHPADFLNFLQLVNSALHAEISTQLSSLSQLHEGANDLAARYPLDFALISAAIVKLIALTRKQKTALTTQDDEGNLIPAKYPPRLRRLINDKAYRKAVKPFVEGEVARIDVSAQADFRNAAEITDENFGDYLSEDEQIFPGWENGASIDVTGKIVSLQCTRGETMKFRVTGAPRKHQLLMAYPSNGQTTQDFLGYYRKDVWIKANVARASPYQKPQLIIKEIGLVQSSLSTNPEHQV